MNTAAWCSFRIVRHRGCRIWHRNCTWDQRTPRELFGLARDWLETRLEWGHDCGAAWAPQTTGLMQGRRYPLHCDAEDTTTRSVRCKQGIQDNADTRVSKNRGHNEGVRGNKRHTHMYIWNLVKQITRWWRCDEEAWELVDDILNQRRSDRRDFVSIMSAFHAAHCHVKSTPPGGGSIVASPISANSWN